jgi:hypothetical protein
MTSLYRKWGSVVRHENGTTIRVDESGEAIESDDLFEARPMQEVAQTRVSVPQESEAARTRVSLPQDSLAVLKSFVAQTLLSVRSCNVERLIVSAGVSRCETNGVAWTEESRRVHLSLVKGRLRVLVDLASFDMDVVTATANALANAGDERKPPQRVRLAPNVSAALLPSLIGEIAIEQRGGGHDGRGQMIETRAVTSDPPPNWYRPSYSIRPRRAWLNLRPLPFGTVDRSAPQAIALLEPVSGTTLRVLCDDGESIFPTTLDAQRIAAVSQNDPVWYPYEGGSFGVEMML